MVTRNKFLVAMMKQEDLLAWKVYYRIYYRISFFTLTHVPVDE